MSPRRPDSVEVRTRMMSKDGARHLTTAEAHTSGPCRPPGREDFPDAGQLAIDGAVRLSRRANASSELWRAMTMWEQTYRATRPLVGGSARKPRPIGPSRVRRLVGRFLAS